MSARLQKVIGDPLSEGKTDIASESDARILNSAQKHFQVLYYIFCETFVNNSFRAGYYMDISK